MSQKKRKYGAAWGILLGLYLFFLLGGLLFFSEIAMFRPVRAYLHGRIFSASDSNLNAAQVRLVEGSYDLLIRKKGSLVFKRAFSGERLEGGDMLYTRSNTRATLKVFGDEEVVLQENSIVVLEDLGADGQLQLGFLAGAWEWMDDGTASGRSPASKARRKRVRYVAKLDPVLPGRRVTSTVEAEGLSEAEESAEPVVIAAVPEKVEEPIKRFFFEDQSQAPQAAKFDDRLAQIQKVQELLESIEEEKRLKEVAERKQRLAELKKRRKIRRGPALALDELFMRETVYIRHVLRNKMGRSPASDITLSVALFHASNGGGEYGFNKAMGLALDSYLRKYLDEGNCYLAKELYANAGNSLTDLKTGARRLKEWKQDWKGKLNKRCR